MQSHFEAIKLNKQKKSAKKGKEVMQTSDIKFNIPPQKPSTPR